MRNLSVRKDSSLWERVEWGRGGGVGGWLLVCCVHRRPKISLVRFSVHAVLMSSVNFKIKATMLSA